MKLTIKIEIEPLEDQDELDPEEIRRFENYVRRFVAAGDFFLRATVTGVKEEA